MTKTVVVTGASGYIGGVTALKLRDADYQVIGIDWRPAPANLRKCFERFYQEDFAGTHGLQLIVDHQPDAIIHCAGTSLVGPSVTNPAAYYDNNFVKTKRMLDTLRDNKLSPRVIFSSSAAVYGEPIMVPCQEVDPPAPISPYGESKYMVELMMTSYAGAYGLDAVMFRYFNACGADSQGRHGQERGATHLIARVLESVINNTDFQLYGDDYPTADGSCVRDYVHVEDIADAHIRAVDTAIPSGIYNLGTANGVSNLEIIARVEAITKQSVNRVVVGRRAGDPACLTASADKYQQVSGWQPKFNLDDMVAHAWKWYTR